MKTFMKTVFVGVLMAATVSVARSEPVASSKYGKAEIKQMERSAHTAQQFEVLSAYFSGKQKWYEQQAQSEKVEWERRNQNVSGPAAKYPRPVDSSKNRYEYFSYEASQMSQQAVKYQALADKSQ